MQVVLRQNVGKLGKAGDVVDVAAGYARNYLLPKRLASEVTPSVLKHAERVRAKRLELEQAELERLATLGERLSGFLCVIEARVNEEGQLFGAVHEREIVEALEAAGFEELRVSNVLLADPIRDAGDHEVEIQLHPEVRVNITVRVTPIQETEEL
jgi:large subunit ribosomal protein L9